jgi:branched-chain amino acid aminotransferase
MTSAPSTAQPTGTPAPAFGTVLAPTMATVNAVDGVYGDLELVPLAPIAMHPAAHALHYGSACFEGLKAHRGADGAVRLFRVAQHAARMSDSAERLCLPVPDVDLVTDAIVRTVAANLDLTPDAPGALYLRPVLLGTLENIGAAAAPSTDALLYVIASPVGDYFTGGDRGLRLWVETQLPRTTPQFGRIKSGANYAMALGLTREKKATHGVDQVLFAPGGDVQETGAANALLLSEDKVVTRGLDDAFLHGVTRDSVLTIARDLGMEVEERPVSVDELYAWCRDGGEVALSGTAAVLTGVGALVTDGEEVEVTGGRSGPVTARLREALLAIQRGQAPDPHGWTREVTTADL